MNILKAEQIGEMAVRALRMEASVTPKPGLVDRENSGAHTDMDYPMFLTSCVALKPCFTACAQTGIQGAGKKPETLVSTLRQIGRCGEIAMYGATKGVNTHKGAIFSMGILCCALGKLIAEAEGNKEITPNRERGSAAQMCVTGGRFELEKFKLKESELQSLCRQIASALLKQDTASATHGMKARGDAACGGVRAEALSGFESAFGTGLAVIRSSVREGIPCERAMIRALMALICRTDDSNVVYRGGAEGLAFLKQQAADVLRRAEWKNEECLDMVREFDKACREKNLSPGGSADLLAFSTMLYMIFDEVSL